jgi:hypothetical protein
LLVAVEELQETALAGVVLEDTGLAQGLQAEAQAPNLHCL